ncbi:MAG: hypothetical protein KC668_29135, partial [Myxococcales bacterium]|nr:hypothetical protein [Myxococcales bacterium]
GAHSILAERHLFPLLAAERPRLRLVMRLGWHIGALGWAAGGVLLIASPHVMTPEGRVLLVAVLSLLFGVSAAGNAYVWRFRHFGWGVLALVIALSVAGLVL